MARQVGLKPYYWQEEAMLPRERRRRWRRKVEHVETEISVLVGPLKTLIGTFFVSTVPGTSGAADAFARQRTFQTLARLPYQCVSGFSASQTFGSRQRRCGRSIGVCHGLGMHPAALCP